MRTLNEVIINAGNASGNLTSTPVLLEFALGYSIQAVIAGTATGTLTLEGSDDFGTSSPISPTSGLGVTNWDFITGSSEPVTGTGVVVYNVQGVFYKWVRLVYTSTAGTGTITARANVKGF